MRNPIHKRLENVESWQHLTFMACLCERMAPNFALFCQMTEQKPADKDLSQHFKLSVGVSNG